jgi:hypothetical protein
VVSGLRYDGNFYPAFSADKRLRTDSLTRHFRRGTTKKNPPCGERIYIMKGIFDNSTKYL